MTPLTTWTCDKCRQSIDGPERGIVAWSTAPHEPYGGFVIVHQTFHKEPQPKNCDPGYLKSLPLTSLVGPTGWPCC